MVSPENGGKVQVDDTLVTAYPFKQIYPANQNVQLKAIPAPGYYFVRWKDTITDEAEAKNSTANVLMTCTKQATAVFALITYKLTVNIDPIEGGQVTISPTQPANGYIAGTEVTASATVNEGFEFNKWTGNTSGDDMTTTVTMDRDREITANFTQKKTLSMAWWLQRIGTGVGIAAVIGLALLLLIRWILIRRRIPKAAEPCSLFLLSQASYYLQIDTDTQ
ncbi:MAG: hypothetical protein PHY28_03440 [Dehalococcoidales bacterium]|nr:hypothetical protein [Dehalococcoidales bacterium]